MKLENVTAPSPAFARRHRRYKQAAREAHQSLREKDGKKPFYITVDSEGVPYGSGKPAWVGEINKLAIALDPSVTHIRKQTYEDVSIFKERLSRSFEYSGALNEDYLRGLMGRAVSKKRRDLMAHIKTGGSQPNHIDSEVWERLLKLHASQQWEEKSNQGKYANACRKSVNRTGNRGVNGVRESLRETLGRSPDPDEVYAEATRPKGSTVTKEKKVTATLKCEEVEGEEYSDNDDDDEELSTEYTFGVRCSDEELGRRSHITSAPQVLMLPP